MWHFLVGKVEFGGFVSWWFILFPQGRSVQGQNHFLIRYFAKPCAFQFAQFSQQGYLGSPRFASFGHVLQLHAGFPRSRRGVDLRFDFWPPAMKAVRFTWLTPCIEKAEQAPASTRAKFCAEREIWRPIENTRESAREWLSFYALNQLTDIRQTSADISRLCVK